MRVLFYISLFFLSVVGCENEDNDDGDCLNVICTLEFRSFSVTLTDANDDFVALDSFQVMDITNNQDLTPELTDEQLQEARQNGRYPLYGDEFAQIHQNETIEIVFKGFISGNEVVSASYEAGADCCHVFISSGNLEIMLN